MMVDAQFPPDFEPDFGISWAGPFPRPMTAEKEFVMVLHQQASRLIGDEIAAMEAEIEVLLKGYNPDQPRAADGRFGEGGDSSNTNDGSASKVGTQAVADRMNASIEKFKSEDGQIIRNVGEQQAEALQEELQTLRDIVGPAEGREAMGFSLTEGALEAAATSHYVDDQSEAIVHVADSGDAIGGAIYGLMQSESEHQPLLIVEDLGSTSITQGAGSALVAEIYKDAAAAGVGVGGRPLEDALPFWKSVGFHPDPTNEGLDVHGMSAEEVKQVVDSLKS